MLNQQIKTLLGEDTISEETATKLAELFEAAVAAAVEKNTEEKDAEKAAALKEKTEEVEAAKKEAEDAKADAEKSKAEKDEAIAKADKAVADAKEESEKRVDEAVQAAAERILTENRDQFLALDRLTRTEKALETIKSAFEANGFSLNENAELDQTKQALEEATKALEETKAHAIDLEAALLVSQCAVALNELTADLADTQREKVEALAESIEVSSVEEYRSAVALIVEQAKTSGDKAPAAVVLEEGTKPNASMAAAVALLARKK